MTFDPLYCQLSDYRHEIKAKHEYGENENYRARINAADAGKKEIKAKKKFRGQRGPRWKDPR